MLNVDKNWFLILSEFFVNLAAGWFGALLIVPNFTGVNYPFNILILTGDSTLCIVSLLIGLKFRKLARRRK
ncbi:hypothetical protein HYT02_02030 [Candidatus Gottesmanbacteria bacterium]|nr:hypothetical protein [Candidatus Gottesmanbacteria bacterium]